MIRLIRLLLSLHVRPTLRMRQELAQRMTDFYRSRDSAASENYYSNSNSGICDPFGYYHRITNRMHPNDRVLDVGCGDARLAAVVAGRGASYFGIDLDFNAVERANTRNDVVEVRRESIHSSTFPAESFDVVVSTYLVEHATDPESTLRAKWSMVCPGGLLIVLCPAATRRWFPAYPWKHSTAGTRGMLRRRRFVAAMARFLEVAAFATALKLREVSLQLGRRPWFPIWSQPRCLDGHPIVPDFDMVYFASDLEMHRFFQSLPDAKLLESTISDRRDSQGQCFLVVQKQIDNPARIAQISLNESTGSRSLVQ